MTLSELEAVLAQVENLSFKDHKGNDVPAHFHLTELGKVERHYIDCGGTVRKEQAVSMQLWTSVDYDHRLSTEKFQGIISLSKSKLALGDWPVEVEYQGETIGRYGLEHSNGVFSLLATETECKAMDACGIPEEKVKKAISNLSQEPSSCCSPSSSCC